MSATIDLRCPTCDAQPGERCQTMTSGRPTGFHKLRPNCPGWTGRDDENRQQCDRCGKWQYPVIHSCKGVRSMTTADPYASYMQAIQPHKDRLLAGCKHPKPEQPNPDYIAGHEAGSEDARDGREWGERDLTGRSGEWLRGYREGWQEIAA